MIAGLSAPTFDRLRDVVLRGLEIIAEYFKKSARFDSSQGAADKSYKLSPIQQRNLLSQLGHVFVRFPGTRNL
jgi:hypothetical protein